MAFSGLTTWAKYRLQETGVDNAPVLDQISTDPAAVVEMLRTSTDAEELLHTLTVITSVHGDNNMSRLLQAGVVEVCCLLMRSLHAALRDSDAVRLAALPTAIPASDLALVHRPRPQALLDRALLHPIDISGTLLERATIE